MFSAELFLQTLIAGVIIGVLYALMALGITFIYSIVKMINWSMGEFYMIGGYLQYLLIVEWLPAGLWWGSGSARPSGGWPRRSRRAACSCSAICSSRY